MALNNIDKKAIERYRRLCQQVASDTGVNPYETESDKVQRVERSKKDYAYFVETYFATYASDKCADFHIKAANMIKKDRFVKLQCAWGRGLAKSTHMNIFVPLWLWICGELKVMVLVGQNEDKAKILLSDLQAQFESNQLLISDFGAQVTLGSWETGNFVTKNDCAFFSLGMGQSPRGLRHRQYRPDYIVADDLDTKIVCKNPKRVREAANWICEDLIPCTDIRGGRFVQVNNVFAPLTIMSQIQDTRKGFKWFQVDATDADFNPTWSAKYTKEYYKKMADDIGMLSFMSEFNNSPYAEGSVFTEDMLVWEDLPRIDHFQRIIAYWDVAYSDKKTADYNAVRVWGYKDKKFYLIDCFVRQCKMSDAIRWMFDYRKDLNPAIHLNFYFESQFWNEALDIVYKEVCTEQNGTINLIKSDRPKGAKIDRIMTTHPYYQGSKIVYNLKHKAKPDFQIGKAQLLGIEPGYKSHDDAPDADAAAIEILSKDAVLRNNTYRVSKKVDRKY